MKKQTYSTTIAIDSERSAIHFYSMIGNDKSTIAHHIKSYAGGRLDEHFFDRFKEAVKEFAQNTPSETVRKVTVVLPDNAVLTDTVRIPTMKGLGQTKKTLDITLGGLYRNYNDLRVVSHVAEQNKQYSTFSIAAVQKNIVSSIFAACSENKLLVDTLTYASSASVGGAVQLNPKLKNASYLFLDIKDVYSRFVFVANGKTVGYYTLPFGLEFLRKPKVTQEDMLFDHSYAELTVLNARERAKSQKLTVMALGEEFADAIMDSQSDKLSEERAIEEEISEELTTDEEAPADEETLTEEEDEGEAEEIAPLRPQINQKIFTRKSPRKLPKFMQRGIPETEEGIAYENFRVFVKWALTLIHGNEKLTEIGKPEFVCVNLPLDLASVLDTANEEAEENGITFTRLPSEGEGASVISNLELYGGLFPKQIATTGKF
ncbi:MAG: hypothetical protein E7679_05250 [Ruminococcaceae bacterium]|nr:hypothetical protein [Oscillospiraceae bacterium]